MTYHCESCGANVEGIKAARKHAKQGHKTQRDAFRAGQLHRLALVSKGSPRAKAVHVKAYTRRRPR